MVEIYLLFLINVSFEYTFYIVQNIFNKYLKKN